MSGFDQTDAVRKQDNVLESASPLLANASSQSSLDANRIWHVCWGCVWSKHKGASEQTKCMHSNKEREREEVEREEGVVIHMLTTHVWNPLSGVKIFVYVVGWGCSVPG